jgi:Mg-chelatase subunit ChlD
MPQARGITNLGKGLTTASILLQKYPDHKKIVVLLTDGIPSDDTTIGVAALKV